MTALPPCCDAEPLWFGPEDRPLLGRLHRPAGGVARGGVLICPPVGIELSHAHFSLRCLARSLCDAGFLVLRFDYDGTGQSAGTMSDPERLPAWRASVRDAIAILRSGGASWLAGVGLRLGATLLADVAAADDELDAIVLWDPCASGKAFLREQLALHRTVCPSRGPEVAADAAAEPSCVEILGYELGASLASELRRFTLPAPETLAGRRVLALVDPSRAGGARLADRLPRTIADWQDYAAAEPVFDTGELGFEPPAALIGQIVDWLGDARTIAGVAPTSTAAPAARAPEAVVAHTENGTAIVETVVDLGPDRLAGIVCAPQSGVRGPTVLFVSVAAESSIGPVRQWVELSRQWAGAGVRCVRLDLSGIGESPARPELSERTVYAHEHVQEMLDAAVAISPDDPADVVLAGVCSGAYQALVAGALLRPRGVIAVNPRLTLRVPDEPGARIHSLPPDVPPALGAPPPPVSRMRRWRRRVGAHTPRAIWRVAYALGVAYSPAARLRPLIRTRVNTLLVLGANEAEVALARTPSTLRRLDASGSSHVAVIPELDHSLRDRSSRDVVAEAGIAFLAKLSSDRSAVTPPPPEARASRVKIA